jgi:hypothetical protein
MKSTLKNESIDDQIATYRRIRAAIGFLGIGLPLALLILPLLPFLKTSIQGSISGFYYTNLRELFTGILCAVGLFLIRYKGYKSSNILRNDNLLTNIAGYMAFGIALFPTDPDVCSQKIYSLFPYCNSFLGYVHYAFALVFFVILALISIKVFTIGQKKDVDIPISLINENKIYRLCGYLILGFILMIPLFAALHVSYSTLIFEALALFSFGTSWLIKGRALGDKGKIGEKLYREKN